ncbi:aminoglycoside phosphotransferase family protein [Magnetococcales bacterium HHB-1]
MTLENSIKLTQAATDFLNHHLPSQTWHTQMVSGDASFRSYYRIFVTKPKPARYILMDAPPDKEDSNPFIDIGRFLAEHGVWTPEIIHHNLDKGYLLLEDMGDITFLRALDQGEAAIPLYRAAIDTLIQMQKATFKGRCIAHERAFDHTLLKQELRLFTDWYIEGILKKKISKDDQDIFDKTFDQLIQIVLQQPQTFVHRDYHSRNLMWHKNRVGVIDFQDAVTGPITYDLISLLKDAYIDWDNNFIDEINRYWLESAKKHLDYTPDNLTFQQDFDAMALQRHIKVVGIFGRLSLRDGKDAYLNDIPRTLSYIWPTLDRYPAFTELKACILRYVTQ